MVKGFRRHHVPLKSFEPRFNNPFETHQKQQKKRPEDSFQQVEVS